MRSASPVRRLAIAAGLLIAVLVACGREITGPVTAPVNVFKRVAAFAFESKYETAVPVQALHAALQQVAFERVRITLRREDGTIALDTVVEFPAGANELTLTLNVPLPASAPNSGVPLSLSLGYVNAAGDTVFKGGPIPVTVTPSTGGGPPAPVQVPVHYTGTGASAAALVLTPESFSGLVGQTTTFSAVALSATGQGISGTPVVFFSNNSGVVSVDENTGAATLVGRGTAKVYAQLLTGPLDSAVVTVTLPASQLQLVSGGAQTGSAGSTLATPVVAQVLASDGIGVSGVTVNFAASGGGTVTPATAVSDASGNVSTQWKLGPTAGAQTLTVTSAGLTGSPLTVSATANAVTPTRLNVLTGPVASRAGVALPPVTVAAQDAAGNTIASFTGDVTVALGANPGGSTLSGTTTAKAVAGVATFSDLKLNRPGTAYTLVFSSAELSAAVSGTFDITSGDASTLVFSAMPSTVDPGQAIAPPITVTAQDAAGNAVASFTGAVTVALGTNPSGAALGGTLTRTAVAGVATFSDLSITTRGSPYTLIATASGLASGTSAGFSVTAGAPAGIKVVSGNAQSAAAGSLLSPITVRLHDAFNNGIEGATIAFAVTGGGGSLSSATALTDADGVATVAWTIGAGPQTMTATHGSLSPTTITATSTSVALMWTGAVNSDWNTAGNWSPAFAPSAADVVTIPVTTTAPTITSPTSVVGVIVAPGATLTNNSTLTILGSLDAGTTITGSGFVILAGASGSLKGMINQALTLVQGVYTLVGATQMTGSLTINGTGKLIVGGQSLTVTSNLSTSASGRLAMTNSADVVTVGGSTTFAGGSENGFLTAGTLIANGGFTATGASFAASGSHTLKMASAVTPQMLAFTSPLSGQGINHLVFEGGGAKTLSGEPQIMGNVSLLVTSAPVGGEVTVKIGGDFADATIFPDSGGYPDPQGGWRVVNTTFFGTNKVINSVFISSNVTVSGTVRLAPCTSCLGEDRFAYVLATNGYVQVNGDVTAAGPGAVLKLNGNELSVNGDFATASGGAVDLTDPNDYLFVAGSATFAGGSTAGKLTLGVLEVYQDFTQSGAPDAFAPSVGFYTYLGDPNLYAGLRASRAKRARATDPVTVVSPGVEAARSRRRARVAPLRAARDERLVKLDRRAAAYASRGMAAPARGQVMPQGRAATEEGVRLLRPRRVYSGTSNISFANPTTSFFGELYLSGPEFVLASDVMVAGELETGYSSWFTVSSSSATPRKLTSHGADVYDLTFDNVSWILLDGSSIWYMDYVTFNNMDPTVDQFTIARTADDNLSCEGPCAIELYYWSFTTAPTTGHYIKATDTNGGPNVLDVDMYMPDPSSHGGHVSTVGGATISNWPETSVVTWLGGTSNDWNVGSNWSGGVVPTSSTDVLIPSGTAWTATTNSAVGYARNLTIESGAHVQTSCSFELFVYGNVVGPLDAPGGETCEGDAIHLMGDNNTVVGSFEMLTIEGNYSVSGPGNQVIVGLSWGVLNVDGTNGGKLTLNGGRVDANQLSIFNGGLIVMTNAADQLFVGNDNALFNGASTAGKLTAGTITVTGGGCLYSGGPALDAFAPSGTHTVIFVGSNCVNFADPINSFFQNVTVNAGATLTVDTDNLSYPGLGFSVNGTLSRDAGAGVMTINAGFALSPRLVKAGGLNITGQPTTFTDVALRLQFGASNATLDNVTFTGFSGYTDYVLNVARNPGEIITFNSLNFSAVTGLGTGGIFLHNSGAATVNIRGSNPATGVLGTHYLNSGAGVVSWIP
ncbi:MAG: Ig-like domain-containing protein [Gemmatimonadaceae bacterium]|nr:Ig-like domain-containing protein [Gemmatimonadaceae bacterium]